MTWGGPNAGDDVVRIIHLDREGFPYREHTSVGRGAFNYSAIPEDGEPDVDLDPLFPVSHRTGELRVHVRTHTQTRPQHEGLGHFSVEVFTPAGDGTSLYVLYPKVVGRLLCHRNAEGLWVVTVFGKTTPNPNLGPLVGTVAPDARLTMLTGATTHRPLAPAHT